MEMQQKLRRVKDILAVRLERGLASPKIVFGESVWVGLWVWLRELKGEEQEVTTGAG